MFRWLSTWWARRQAVVAWLRVHRAQRGELPRYDPENGMRLWWRFDLNPNQGFDPNTGAALCGWHIARAHAHRRKLVLLAKGWQPRGHPSMWIVDNPGDEVRLIDGVPPRRPPKPPPRPPRGGSNVRPPPVPPAHEDPGVAVKGE